MAGVQYRLDLQQMLKQPSLGCAGFAKKNFSLQSKTKRNEIRFACVSHAHVKNKQFCFASFRFEFFASDLSEINRPYFHFVSLPKIFRFASDLSVSLLKQNKINVFSLCFTSKRNEIYVFFAFHHTRYRHEKVKDQP